MKINISYFQRHGSFIYWSVFRCCSASSSSPSFSAGVAGENTVKRTQKPWSSKTMSASNIKLAYNNNNFRSNTDSRQNLFPQHLSSDVIQWQQIHMPLNVDIHSTPGPLIWRCIRERSENRWVPCRI